MSLNSCKVWFSKMRLGEVLTEVLLNIYALWVVTLCWLVKSYRHFENTTGLQTSITINKLIQHNIPEDMNLQSKTSHRIFSDDENSDVHMSSYGNPPASEVCTKTFLRNESGHLTQWSNWLQNGWLVFNSLLGQGPPSLSSEEFQR
jgi:hypothetical protein